MASLGALSLVTVNKRLPAKRIETPLIEVLPGVFRKFSEARCEICPLAKARCIYPDTMSSTVDEMGNAVVRVAAIGESPGWEELAARDPAQRKPFIGASGTILREAIKEHHLDSYGVHLDNALMCDPISIKPNEADDPETAAWKAEQWDIAKTACRPRLISTLKELKVKGLKLL